MSNIDIVLFVLSNIGSFLIGAYFHFKNGLKLGYEQGSKDEVTLMGLSIARAFKDNKQEALDKVNTEYRRLNVEIEQELQNIKNNV
jgi:hypothetical protein